MPGRRRSGRIALNRRQSMASRTLLPETTDCPEYSQARGDVRVHLVDSLTQPGNLRIGLLITVRRFFQPDADVVGPKSPPINCPGGSKSASIRQYTPSISA